MKANKNKLSQIYDLFLSEQTKQKSEYVIITIAIASFIIHLSIIALNNFDLIPLKVDDELLKNPIAAIYTPFSFILLYEVYLLVYYLPKSISKYINKQYEIIALVVIRRIFKDLSNIDLTINWFQSYYDLLLSYDLITTILLLGLIVLFNKLSNPKIQSNTKSYPEKLKLFINQKKILALILVPVFISLALYSLGNWIMSYFYDYEQIDNSIRDINDIFFNEFFTILILADVLLLLFSLYHTDRFSKVVRNSGFIISTILIRLSFSTVGLTNDMLILTAVAFGVLILFIHNQFEHNKPNVD